MAEYRQPWRARIKRMDGTVVGAGFLIHDRRLLTCAHVVADALRVSATGTRPDGSVLVDFPGAGPAASVAAIPARVVEGGWIPVSSDERGDVAVLDLADPPPAEVKPAPLRELTSRSDHQLTTFGYPSRINHGEWARAVVAGPSGPGGEWVQLDGDTESGRRIERGFSGAAVYDPQASPGGSVVGMIVARDSDSEVSVAWMLPVATLTRAWPPLTDLVSSRLQVDPEFRGHWEPRGRGVQRRSHPGWYFTGRTRVLHHLVTWLNAPAGSDPKARVVTGSPGSGKSAVLARLVSLADPTYRTQLAAELLRDAPVGTVPAPGSIDIAMHAAGKTITELTAKIIEATGITAGSPEELVEELLDSGDPLTIVLDALDEATDPAQITRTLLQPLAVDGGRVGIRLVVGTRRELLGLLRAGAQVLDLDEPAWHDRDDLSSYVYRLLMAEAVPDASTPYQNQPALARLVADAVAARADPNFLIAQLTARDLADRPLPVDTSQPGWQGQFPDTVAAAMDRYLARYGADSQRLTDLLLPLAWAQGAGLADDQVWAELATALGTAAYHDYDVRGVRDTTVGALLRATPTEDGQAYRLFHEALAEYLRSKRPDQQAHRAYSRTLLAHTPRQPDQQLPDWTSASDYTQTYLAVHAAYTRELDPLLADPTFILHADLDQLLRVLGHADTAGARRAAITVQRASHHLRSGSLAERAAYLQLTARQLGDAHLAEAIDRARLSLAWRTPWAAWRPQAPHQILAHKHGLSIPARTFTLPDGQPIAITGSHDGTIQLWDLSTGTPRTNPIPAHESGVTQLAVATLPNGQTIAISGGGDGSIRLWNLPAGTPGSNVLLAHWSPVTELAITTLPDGGIVAITGGRYDGIRLWDLPTGARRTSFSSTHLAAVTQLAVTTLPDGQPIAITTSTSTTQSDTIRLWDPATGTPRTDPIPTNQGAVTHLAITTLPDGQPVAITASDDGTIRLWDPATGTPRTDPIPTHEGGVTQLTVTAIPHGQAVAITSGRDGSVRVWNVDQIIENIQSITAHEGGVAKLALATLPHGQTVAITGGDDGTIQLWDPATGTPRTHPIPGHQGAVTQLAITTLPDGQPIALTTGRHDNTIRLWDPATGIPRTDPIPTPWGVSGLAVATMPDGQTIAITGDYGGSIRVWDLLTGTPRTDPIRTHQLSVYELAVTTLPDGQVIAITGGGDGTICLWDLPSGTPRTDPIPAHWDGVSHLAATTLPDGQPIAITSNRSQNGSIRLWDLATGTPRTDPIPTDQGGVTQLAITTLPDGQAIAITGGRYGSICLWDLPSGTPRTDPILVHQSEVTQLAITTLPDGRVIAITAGGQNICIHSLPTAHMWRQIDVGSQVRAAMLLVDGLVAVGTQMGLLGLLNALPATIHHQEAAEKPESDSGL
jgi:WD40 repeat protein